VNLEGVLAAVEPRGYVGVIEVARENWDVDFGRHRGGFCRRVVSELGAGVRLRVLELGCNGSSKGRTSEKVVLRVKHRMRECWDATMGRKRMRKLKKMR